MSAAAERDAGPEAEPQGLGGPPELGDEWARLSDLLRLCEAARAGGDLPESFAARFDALDARVRQARGQGAWDGLAALCGAPTRAQLTQLDIDVLALALLRDALPMTAARVAALQPLLRTAAPSLGLTQEILGLETAAEVDQLYARLAPDAPLVAGGLVQIERDGDQHVLQPCAGVAAAVLGRAVDLGAPPGTHLCRQRVRLDDLVVPPGTRTQLDGLLAWARQREEVARQWRGRRLGGPIALFSGPSGTGKTCAAGAVAGELRRPLYRLDLGRVMSKWVGETEQNMNRLLDALHGRRAALAIDECDALLGKRGEIADARDRYANLEVSHLLSRLERHDGPVILTTNSRANVDPAFLRRFHAVIDFARPDAAARARLWARLLSADMPRAPELEPVEPGGAVALSGGAIENAAFYAAVRATEEGRPLNVAHAAHALWRELAKENRPVRPDQLGPLARHLPASATAEAQEEGMSPCGSSA